MRHARLVPGIAVGIFLGAVAAAGERAGGAEKLKLVLIRDAPDPWSPALAELSVVSTFEARPTDAGSGGARNEKAFSIRVTVEMENEAGDVVRVLHAERPFEFPKMPASAYHTVEISVPWDGRDGAGKIVPDDPYTYIVRGALLRRDVLGNGKVQEHLVGVSGALQGTVDVDSTPPQITEMTPSAGSIVAEKRPVISASFSDNTGIDVGRTEVELDGDPVAPDVLTEAGFQYTPTYDLLEGDHTVEVTVYDVAGNSDYESSTWTVRTVLPPPPTLSCVRPAGLTTKGLGFFCLNSDQIGQDDETRRVYKRGTFSVEIEAEGPGAIATARCLMYEFDRVAGDEEWPFYDYATSPEARRALQQEGVEVGTATIQPRPGGALVTFSSFTGLVVEERTQVYAFKFIIADAAGTESSLVMFCKYDATPAVVGGSASGGLSSSTPEGGEAGNPGKLVRGQNFVYVEPSKEVYSFTVDGKEGKKYDYGKLHVNGQIPVSLGMPPTKEFDFILTDLYGNVSESQMTVSVDTKGLVFTLALHVLDEGLDPIPIEWYELPYGEVFPLMAGDGLAVEVHQVGYRLIPGTVPPRYEWTGTWPDHIALASPGAGTMWHLAVQQIENNRPLSKWLAGPGNVMEILLLVFGEPDLGAWKVMGLPHPLVEVDGLVGKGRPVEFACTVSGPGKIDYAGIRIGDRNFLRLARWGWFKDGEEKEQELPAGCFVNWMPFDRWSAEEAAWLASHGPVFPVDPEECEGVLLNLAGELGTGSRLNRAGRRRVAVDLGTTYYDGVSFTAEAPYKAILVEAWPHYVPAGPTTVHIRGWFGDDLEEGDTIATSEITFKKDGVEINPATAEIVYDDPANRDLVQAIRCEVDFSGASTGLWDILIKVGEVQNFTLKDAVYVVKVEIEVNDTSDEDDDIVCRYSTSPAGRPTVPCRARVQGLSSGSQTVVLTNKAGDGELRFPAKNDASVTLQLPANGNWVPFTISGQTESTNMGDAVVEAHLDTATGAVCAEEDATVLCVEMAGRNSGSLRTPNVYEDRQNIVNATGLSNFGVHMDGIGRPYARGMVEIRGRIQPEDFDVGPIPVNPEQVRSTDAVGVGWRCSVDLGFVINRRADGRRIYRNGTEEMALASFGPGANVEDDSRFEFQDVTPDVDPQDNDNLVVVDVDAPAGGPLSGGADTRARIDFTQWVTFTYDVGGSSAVVRCSNDSEWATRMRIIQDAAGNAVLWRHDADGNGMRDPGDDFPNDGTGENEVIVGGHNVDLNP